jgi:hypothetical protein
LLLLCPRQVFDRRFLHSRRRVDGKRLVIILGTLVQLTLFIREDLESRTRADMNAFAMNWTFVAFLDIFVEAKARLATSTASSALPLASVYDICAFEAT